MSTCARRPAEAAPHEEWTADVPDLTGLNCRELVDFLYDYVTEELPEEQRALFDVHLEHCPPCIFYVDSYRETIELGKQCLCEDPEARTQRRTRTPGPGDPRRPQHRALLVLRERGLRERGLPNDG